MLKGRLRKNRDTLVVLRQVEGEIYFKMFPREGRLAARRWAKETRRCLGIPEDFPINDLEIFNSNGDPKMTTNNEKLNNIMWLIDRYADAVSDWSFACDRGFSPDWDSERFAACEDEDDEEDNDYTATPRENVENKLREVLGIFDKSESPESTNADLTTFSLKIKATCDAFAAGRKFHEIARLLREVADRYDREYVDCSGDYTTSSKENHYDKF